ncbi:MAG: DinB family protein [Anaerolineae bacterium]|nr:DinB family protein [Anaerolineae bacterium]
MQNVGMQTKTEIAEQLREAQQGVAESTRALTPAQFNQQTDDRWAAADYLAHLILSVKPFAKAMSLPAERVASLFGQADRPSRTYPEVIALYDARLAEGIRAEDNPLVVPMNYRFPDDVDDKQAYLIATWLDGNERLINGLDQWDEADLDRYVLPHPAIGMITLREMLYFTIHHNHMHLRDIEQAGA